MRRPLFGEPSAGEIWQNAHSFLWVFFRIYNFSLNPQKGPLVAELRVWERWGYLHSASRYRTRPDKKALKGPLVAELRVRERWGYLHSASRYRTRPDKKALKGPLVAELSECEMMKLLGLEIFSIEQSPSTPTINTNRDGEKLILPLVSLQIYHFSWNPP